MYSKFTYEYVVFGFKTDLNFKKSESKNNLLSFRIILFIWNFPKLSDSIVMF